MKSTSLIVLAAVAMSLPAYAASEATLNGEGSSIANSLAPSASFNTDVANDATTFVMGPAIGSPIMDTSLASQVNLNGSPVQDFSAIAAGNVNFNNSGDIGTETIKTLPEPTTLALTTLGGLSALVFARKFKKSPRA